MNQMTNARGWLRAASYLVSVLALMLTLGAHERAFAQWETNGNNINNTNTGNVGIGTGEPNARLVVASGNVGVGTNNVAPWTAQTSVIESLDTSIFFGTDTDLGLNSNAYHSSGWKYKTADPAANVHLYKGTIYFRTAAAGAAGSPLSWTDAMFIDGGGSVGVGTTSPQAPLHLSRPYAPSYGQLALQDPSADGAAATVYMSFFDTNSRAGTLGFGRYGGASDSELYLVNEQSGGGFRFRNASSDLFTIANSGRVGVGTTSPASIFSVNLSNTDYTNTGGAGSHLLMTNPSATGQNVVTSIINGTTVAKWRTDYAGNISSVAGPTGRHDFYTGGDYPTGAVRMTILNNGNVGIGVSSPTTKLHVDGDVTVTGNIAAKYQDVAEWVPSSQKLAAGTVVVLDQTASNHVVSSTSAYDTAVAGVVSEQPGLILGEGGEGKLKVATTGRVRVKVDATNAPIKIGDLLVTSDVEGVAMRSEPITVGGRKLHAPGTIIGKALEPLAGGTGEILVLLSMQ